MADTNRDRPHPHQLREQLRDQQPLHQRYEAGFRTSKKGPSTGKILAVVSLRPLGGILLGLAALTLMGSLIGLAITTPLFVICSPVLLPAAIGVGLAVTGFLTSGAFALTGLSSLSWILNSIKEKTMHGQEPLEFAMRKMQDVAVQFGQKTKDVGQTIQSKAQEEKK